MILSRNEILKAIKEKRIKITPFDEACVGPCSVDVHLGNLFKKFASRKQIIVDERFKKLGGKQLNEITIKNNEFISIKPQELVLGATLERITLSNDLCGRIEGRSRFARAGLLVHVSSSLIQPGSDNVQVLEIINVSPAPMRLRPGTRVCQIVFEELKGKAVYEGEFKKQRAP